MRYETVHWRFSVIPPSEHLSISGFYFVFSDAAISSTTEVASPHRTNHNSQLHLLTPIFSKHNGSHVVPLPIRRDSRGALRPVQPYSITLPGQATCGNLSERGVRRRV